MAQQDREHFVENLQQTIAEIFPDKDGFQLIVESGGEKTIFLRLEILSNPEAEIEALINEIGDND